MTEDLFHLPEEAWSRLTGGVGFSEEGDEKAQHQLSPWQILVSALSVHSVNDNPRSQIVFEFIYNIIRFCIQSNFSYAQVSAVLAVFGQVFSKCVVDSVSNKTREDAIGIFTSHISQLARGPDGGAPLLDVGAVKGVTALFSDTLVKNFDAYQLVMQELPIERAEELRVIVQTPISSLPLLSEGERLDPSAAPSVTAAVEGEEDA